MPLGKADAVAQLGHAIAGRGRCLVILDNLEQVLEPAAAVVHRWLERAGAASFLVTSRERLGLDGESILDVGPMGMEPGLEWIPRRSPRWGGQDRCPDRL